MSYMRYIYLLKRNKTKHEQSKKHKKYFSHMISNRHVIKNVKVSDFKDESNPYFIEHSGKLKFFTISILLRLYNEEHPLNEKNKGVIFCHL